MFSHSSPEAEKEGEISEGEVSKLKENFALN